MSASGPASPIGRALGLLGDEWTLLIVRYGLAGARRYSDWRQQLGIADAVLADRLGALTATGILEPRRYSDRPERFEYHLTEAGRDLWRVLVSIWGWEVEWVEGQAEVLPTMRHRSCGSVLTPVLACAACDEPAGPADVYLSGNDAALATAVPVGANRRRTRRGVPPGPGLFPETMALVGNRWSSALLCAAFLGARRFGEFGRWLGAPPATVADRLRTCTGLGVLESRPDGAYDLTAKGEAFFPVVANFLGWGERWLSPADESVVALRHRACDRPFVPVLQCGTCDARLERGAVGVELADSA